MSLEFVMVVTMPYDNRIDPHENILYLTLLFFGLRNSQYVISCSISHRMSKNIGVSPENLVLAVFWETNGTGIPTQARVTLHSMVVRCFK